MGLTVTTGKDKNGNDMPIKLWRNDDYGFPSYSVSVSSKDKDGNYIRSYIRVDFKKGTDIPSGTDIIIKDAFYKVSQGKNGQKYTSIFITDYEVLGAGVMTENGFMDLSKIEVDELPFN